jgi:CDP-diacylglycerol--glycerol-3-phosphate 3-phosphatidyltransferase
MIKYVPNMLTGGRLVLTAVFIVMILYSPTVENKPMFLTIAFVLFVIAGLTDIIDGKVARKYNVTSKFGRMIDPLADKILVCGTFASFAIIGQPKLFDLDAPTLTVIHWSVFAVLTSREVYVTILRHHAEAKGINFAATISGKIKMFLQSFAIGTVIIKAAYVSTATWGSCFTSTVFLITVVVTVISGIASTRRRLGQ